MLPPDFTAQAPSLPPPVLVVAAFQKTESHGQPTPSVSPPLFPTTVVSPHDLRVSSPTLTRSKGDFFPPAFNCPHELERIGALGDGGKWLCGLSRLESKPDCVVYSIGAATHASFEAELLARTRFCEVWGFDFTVPGFGPEITAPHKSDSDWRAYFAEPVEHFYTADGQEREEGADAEEGGRKEYWSDRGKSLERRTHFKPWGVAGHDAPATSDKPPIYTIESLMRLNGMPSPLLSSLALLSFDENRSRPRTHRRPQDRCRVP